MHGLYAALASLLLDALAACFAPPTRADADTTDLLAPIRGCLAPPHAAGTQAGSRPPSLSELEVAMASALRVALEVCTAAAILH